jgi:diaminohydroxyphosphoribosylaminopyrimidine deaminase / 5-amino-6-(5-phosphoribosylamino)uracil reductase
MYKNIDIDYLKETITLAKNASLDSVKTNPRVGAILVDNQNTVVGAGWHTHFGGPHAEVNAINEAIAKGINLANCTLYVSLEPCSHVGKTPPCTSLIVKSGIKKVIIASKDPNPLVKGIEELKENRVDVTLITLEEALELNKRFFINHLLNRPLITVKVAVTKSGLMANSNGESQWITNEESRAFVHKELRNKSDAILSTATTIIRDNASLNIRIGKTSRELTSIVLDSSLRIFKERNLNIHQFRETSKLIVVSKTTPEFEVSEYTNVITDLYIENRVDLKSLMHVLYNRYSITNLLVEAGPSLCNSLFKENLVDDFFCFIGNKEWSENDKYKWTNPELNKKYKVVNRFTIKNDTCIQYNNQEWKMNLY